MKVKQDKRIREANDGGEWALNLRTRMKRVDVESRVCVDELGSGNGKNFRLTNRPKERAKILMILSK
jgi:hypothetical protein